MPSGFKHINIMLWT